MKRPRQRWSGTWGCPVQPKAPLWVDPWLLGLRCRGAVALTRKTGHPSPLESLSLNTTCSANFWISAYNYKHCLKTLHMSHHIIPRRTRTT